MRYLRLLLLLLFLTSTAHAGEMVVAWSPVDHSDLAGYRIYSCTDATLANCSPLGTTTETTVTLTVPDCTVMFVAVKSFKTDGVESTEFSNVIEGWARPSISDVTYNSVGITTINGNNFRDSPTVLVDGAQLPPANVCSGNACPCTAITITPPIPGATIVVINADTSFGQWVRPLDAPVISRGDTWPEG